METPGEPARWTDTPFEGLEITDEAAFSEIALYGKLKAVVQGAGLRFRVLSGKQAGRWDRALLLNLTFWSAADESADVLIEPTLPADVVTHIAWHHLAHRALFFSHPPTAQALFFGEAIASAFDLYLIGKLLAVGGSRKGGKRKKQAESEFLSSQLPIIAEVAQQAGLDDRAFSRLLAEIAEAPESAFEDLRQLLFDTSTLLCSCRNATQALELLCSSESHRFSPLLHHYELSNWVLYARAYAGPSVGLSAENVASLDSRMRAASDSVALLAEDWVKPNLV